MFLVTQNVISLSVFFFFSFLYVFMDLLVWSKKEWMGEWTIKQMVVYRLHFSDRGDWSAEQKPEWIPRRMTASSRWRSSVVVKPYHALAAWLFLKTVWTPSLYDDTVIDFNKIRLCSTDETLNSDLICTNFWSGNSSYVWSAMSDKNNPSVRRS